MSDPNIYQRINAVRDSIGVLGKDARVQGYKALTHDKVTRTVVPLMSKHGICSTVSLLTGEVCATGRFTKNEAPIAQYQAVYECHLINVDNPEERVRMVIGAHADDPGDKAPGKAISYATKTFYLKVFGVETGENDEERVEEYEMPEGEARAIRILYDNADVQRLEDGTIDSHEGVAEFAEHWFSLGEAKQKAFGSWIYEWYEEDKKVSSIKAHMKDVCMAYREIKGQAA